MLTGVDHVIFAVRDPDAAAAALGEELGLVASGGGRHDSHGTFNRLLWLGDSYIELMGVFDPALASRSWWGAHMLSVLETGTDRYAGVVIATDDLAGDVARLREMGSSVSDPADGQRVRPDGEIVRWRTARLPAPDPELGLVFLIEHDATGAEWRADERAARAEVEMPGLGLLRITRVEFGALDVARASMRLLREFGLQFRPSLAGGGARDTSIGRQVLRLTPRARDATIAIAIRATAAAQARRATALGCDWLIEPG